MTKERPRMSPIVAATIGRRYCIFYLFVICAAFSSTVPFEDIYYYTRDSLADIPSIQLKSAKKTTIAFATTVTAFSSSKKNRFPKESLYDRAAVFHQSLKQAMKKSDRYDYHLYAFIHPDAIEVKPMFEKLGYRVQVRDTPFNISDVQNEDLIDAQRSGCCAEKEYLKLYTYLLSDYPVALHTDLDYMMLKPMEDVFDLMVDPGYNRSKFAHAMWDDMNTYNGSIDFMYTRDYNMVNPGKRQPRQIGVQGGFLAVRPSREDFDKFVSVILSGGDFKSGRGWGGLVGLEYGGYYGSGTIQGLASYYYGELEPNRDIELNRCYYNAMVDEPMHYNKITNTSRCRTLEEECQDCTETPLEDIYSAHFTVCGKVEYCKLTYKLPLCQRLHHEWHKMRNSLEQEWVERYPGYDPGLAVVGDAKDAQTEELRMKGGHCGSEYKTKKYKIMVFPEIDSETETLI